VDGVIVVLVIVVVVALIATGAYFSSKARAERRAALAALATELGMSFDPGERRDFDAQYRHFELFRRGHTRRAYNTLSGTFNIGGRPFPGFLGDYRYSVTTSDGKSTTTTTYHVSYIIMHTPFADLPTLLVRPEGLFDKIAGAVGFDDIDFESEQFSRAFYVKSSDKRFAYDVITARMMEFLLERRGPAIDLASGAVCVIDGTRRWSPEEFRDRLAFVQRFFELWPEHLLSGLDARRAETGRS
jgi:hypothetical protein